MAAMADRERIGLVIQLSVEANRAQRAGAMLSLAMPGEVSSPVSETAQSPAAFSQMKMNCLNIEMLHPVSFHQHFALAVVFAI